MSHPSDRTVTVAMTLAESEALTLFLAERVRLWHWHAASFGVADPSQLPERLVAAHQVAIAEFLRR